MCRGPKAWSFDSVILCEVVVFDSPLSDEVAWRLVQAARYGDPFVTPFAGGGVASVTDSGAICVAYAQLGGRTSLELARELMRVQSENLSRFAGVQVAINRDGNTCLLFAPLPESASSASSAQAALAPLWGLISGLRNPIAK